MTEGAWLLFLLTTLATPMGPAVEVTATRHATEARCEQEKKKVIRPDVVAQCERASNIGGTIYRKDAR